MCVTGFYKGVKRYNGGGGVTGCKMDVLGCNWVVTGCNWGVTGCNGYVKGCKGWGDVTVTGRYRGAIWCYGGVTI